MDAARATNVSNETFAADATRKVLERGTQRPLSSDERLSQLGLQLRAALHTGECERRNDDLGGIAVHIASRILGRAERGDILVSRTVKDLVVGSGISLEEVGETSLRDIDGMWLLYSVSSDASWHPKS